MSAVKLYVGSVPTNIPVWGSTLNVSLIPPRSNLSWETTDETLRAVSTLFF